MRDSRGCRGGLFAFVGSVNIVLHNTSDSFRRNPDKAAPYKGTISQHYRELCKLASSTLTEGWASILSRLFFLEGLTDER